VHQLKAFWRCNAHRAQNSTYQKKVDVVMMLYISVE